MWRTVRCSLIWVMAAMTLSACGVSDFGAQPDNKSPQKTDIPPSRINEENFEKIKQGKGKLTERDVITLLGPPTGKGKPVDGFTTLIWEEKTHITATLEDGKTINLNADFLPQLKSKTITEDNLKKLKKGIKEAELKKSLGTQNYEVQVVGEGTYTYSWGKVNTFEIQFRDGKVTGYMWIRTT